MYALKLSKAGFDPLTDIPKDFLEFLLPLHHEFTPRQRLLAERRREALLLAHRGVLPDYLAPSPATTEEWKVEIPDWCRDQRNQMTGPADEAELVVKMLNSGAPGVLLDLEDSMANEWPNLRLGLHNILEALRGSLSYFDSKRNRTVAIKPSGSVIWLRPRGLHLAQAGVFDGEPVSASLFDTASIVYGVDPRELRHPLCFYIPKSESAEEALWWRDLFQALARKKGLPEDYIKCMALVESHPLAYQMEEFAYNLKDHLLGLNLGRWDYMASLIHFNMNDPDWVLPDRNTIPHDVPFFQNLRELLVDVCHKHGLLAIGGMTALYPSRTDLELNARALKVLAEDKKNEAASLMDGAWTGHPDQNEIALAQFPFPNQGGKRVPGAPIHPDLRPSPRGVGWLTLEGTRAAVRTVIRYRFGVLIGKGASLLDGYMEDLATDRIYRLMIAQRMLHRDAVEVEDAKGEPAPHTQGFVSGLFDEELARLVSEYPSEARAKLELARRQSEEMIRSHRF